MLIHPWDATVDDDEWRDWLAGTDRFGVLAVNNLDPAQAPILIPTHASFVGGELLLHLARPNPVWRHLEAAAETRFALFGDYAYIPGYWRAEDPDRSADGVPTSYYTSVQFVCRPTIVDDPQGKSDVLNAQLADFQPEGRHGEAAVGEAPYGRMLPGIRGVRLAVLRVEAKFKYDDDDPVQTRERVNAELRRRGRPLDVPAAAAQRRRLREIGDWKTFRDSR